MSEQPADQRPPNPPIIAAVDGSAVSYQAAAWAAVDAALHGCPLHIVTSAAVQVGFGPEPLLSDDDIDYLRRDGERVVAEAARIATLSAPGAAVSLTTEVTLAPIIPYLIDQSRQARTLVLGSRGRGALRRGLLGSVSTAITQHAHCPVAVIHGVSATDPISAQQPVLVGVDGSPNSMPAIEIAFQEASLRKVGLTAVHAWSDADDLYLPLPGWDIVCAEEHELLAERLAGFAERYPDVEVNRILVRDKPTRALLEESDNAQLLVVGSHGRGGFTGMLLGATSNAVLHSADCPTLVVRGS